MNTLRAWLADNQEERRVLDLGCGGGSFDYGLYGCSGVIGVDAIATNLKSNDLILPLCADAASLPFPPRSFDLVICHHNLEHCRDARKVVREIHRVLKPAGRLFVSVPEAASPSDRLYRLMLAGGGHYQRFTFGGVIDMIESETSLHLVSWQTLYTSFSYIDRMNFVPSPKGRLPGPLPRRMRWIGGLPSPAFYVSRFLLNVLARFADRWFSLGLARGGWAMAFDASSQEAVEEEGLSNVCMSCGCGFHVEELLRALWFFYRCPRCRTLNPLFTKPIRAGRSSGCQGRLKIPHPSSGGG